MHRSLDIILLLWEHVPLTVVALPLMDCDISLFLQSLGVLRATWLDSRLWSGGISL